MNRLSRYHIAVVIVLAVLLVIAKLYATEGRFRTLALVFGGILMGHIGEAIARSTLHSLRAYHIGVVIALAVVLAIAKYASHGEHFRSITSVCGGILIGVIGEMIAWHVYK